LELEIFENSVLIFSVLILQSDIWYVYKWIF